jgi:tetratricopeptide repeat protein
MIRPMPRTTARRIACAGALLVLGSVAPLPVAPLGERPVRAATAEENAAIGKITLLNREAIEEYRKLNFDEAQRLLDQALDLAAGAGLTQHPIRARTYVTLGVVSAGGLKRRDVAVRLFRKALQIQPEITLSPELATPDVQAAFDEAVRGLGNEPKIERLPSELLVHEPVTAGTRGDPITIAVTPDEGLHAERVMLAYRAAGLSAFSKIKMQKESDGVFEAIIPAPATRGSDVAYYIEARDLDDKLVAARGSPIAPMVIALAPRPEEAGFAVVEAAPARAAAGDGDGASAPVASVSRAPASPARRNEPRVLIALLAGSGGGWSSGTAETSGYSLGSAKLGWSTLGQLVPQIGYLVSSRFMLSAWGRFQLVRGASDYHTPAGSAQCGGDGVCSAARGAFAGFASATFFAAADDDVLRPFLSLSIGGGQIRHVVNFTSGKGDCGADRQQSTCTDTVALGPFLAGPGIGVHVRVAPAVRLIFAVQSIYGAPRFTADIDADAGLAVTF